MMKCFAGYSENNNIIQNASSGGITTAISHYILQNNGVVYGVQYKNDFKNIEYGRSTNEDSLVKFMGSKYVKFRVDEETINNIISDLQSNKKVLFIGMPCNTFLLRKKIVTYQSELLENLLIIDMICSGAVSNDVLKDYTNYLENKFNSNIVELSMRKKCPDWIPPFLYVKFANGKIYKDRLYRTDFGLALSNMLCEECYHCQLRGNNRCSDITVGDMWGINEKNEIYNKKGVSVVISHTEKGEHLLNSLQSVVLSKIEINQVEKNNPRYSSCSKASIIKEDFIKQYSENGLHRACINTMKIKQRMIYLFRNLKSMGITYLK